MPGPQLQTLQRLFKSAVVDSSGAESYLRTPDGQELEHSLVGATADERWTRLDIYAEGYFSRLNEALTTVFPVTQEILGDVFDSLTAHYLDTYPSQSPTLSDLGKEFPAFIDTKQISEERPFLSDLTRFEWALWKTLHTPFSEVPVGEQMTAETPIVRQSTVSLLQTDWHVAETWETDGSAIPEEKESQCLVFWIDPSEGTRFSVIDQPRLWILKELESPQPVGHLMERFAGIFPDTDPGSVQNWFGDWLGLRVIHPSALEC